MKARPSKKHLVVIAAVALLAGCAGGYLAADPDPSEEGSPEPDRPAGPPRLVREAGAD